MSEEYQQTETLIMDADSREKLVAILLKTKRQIQSLSSITNMAPDIVEIKELLCQICYHEKEWDSFDTGPEESTTIEYCPKCETIFKK